MEKIDDDLLSLENEFKSLKKKIEKYHIIFIIVYFSLIALTILIFQKYFTTLYNILLTKIILYSLMIIGLIIHFFLRYTFYKNRNYYQKFFNNNLKKIQKKFSDKNNFNKSIVDYIIKSLKNNDLQISKKDFYDLNFWGLLIKHLNIEPDEIIKNL